MYDKANDSNGMWKNIKDMLIGNGKLDKKNDLNMAYQENVENFDKFQHSQEFKSWVAGKDWNELQFQTVMKRFCGQNYTGPLPHWQGNLSTSDWLKGLYRSVKHKL